ncbi:ATP-binding protein (plasmid) [Rhodococcoides fascians]|uniref:ATP-binding protein n=1 Tax=Nocardiaceae TaxID=85025 RepID=UPI001AE8C689|nr:MULTISPECIES: ATP-binding protein [Rhodococcus]MBP2527328.1 hypothetical protein [Rhodococcus sp. PvP104]WQH31262.1 ATP-binding protein [Rhodococcus fascians]
MSAFDLDRLPTGQHQWRMLIETLLAVGDDRHEGHHLELKSEVDMSTKAGRAKIAKFILATANRPPSFAATRFGGYAVMLVGLNYKTTPSAIAGAARFDDKDLRREVTNFVGDPGPGWDYRRIDVDGDEVVAIIVEPPEQAAIWPCLRDGDGIKDGVIYLRPGAATRPATGPQVTAMVDRVHHAQPAVDIDIEILGKGWVVGCDPAAAIEHIRDAAADLRTTCPNPPTGSTTTQLIDFIDGVPLTVSVPDRESRSRIEFHAEIDSYEAAAIEAVEEVRAAVVATVPGFSVRVTNKTKRSLDDVEVVIHLDPPVDVVAHVDKISGDQLPERPRKWGRERFRIPGLREPFYPSPDLPAVDGWMGVVGREDGGLDLAVDVGHLRPLCSVDTDVEFVLTLPAGSADTAIRARWSMTARGVHEKFTGEVHPLPVSPFDVSATVSEHVALEIQDQS